MIYNLFLNILVWTNSESNFFEKFQLRVYLRTYALEQMVQAASSSAGLRTIKRVEQTLQDLGVCLWFLYLCHSIIISHMVDDLCLAVRQQMNKCL